MTSQLLPNTTNFRWGETSKPGHNGKLIPFTPLGWVFGLGLGCKRSPSWWGQCVSFWNLLLPITIFRPTHSRISLDVTKCSFTNACKTRTPMMMETLPLLWTNRWSYCGHGISNGTLFQTKWQVNFYEKRIQPTSKWGKTSKPGCNGKLIPRTHWGELMVIGSKRSLSWHGKCISYSYQ